MAIVVFAASILFIFTDSSVSAGSVTQNTPEEASDQNDWSFGIAEIPSTTMGWLYDQVYTPSESKQESNSKENQTPAKIVVDFDESANEPESPKKVDDILKIIRDSSDEEKKQYVPFLKNLEDTLTNNPARYAKVFVKNMWHVVDLGIFNSGERLRNVENVKTTLQVINDLLYEIISSLYNFVTGKAEEGKKEAQKGWATFERIREGDHREWTEEQALKKLQELDSQYKNMEKEAVIKDITSLCMQPLYKASTYEKISEFLQKLKQGGFEEIRLNKDFNYMEYKLQFSKNHGMN